jgi:hypothetical protein
VVYADRCVLAKCNRLLLHYAVRALSGEECSSIFHLRRKQGHQRI